MLIYLTIIVTAKYSGWKYHMTVLLVGGVNRSGTTLLQSILCSDPTTNPLVQEASYINSIVHAWAFGRAHFDFHGQYYFDSTQDLKQFTADWLSQFLNKFRNRYPAAKNLVLRYLPMTARFPELYELMEAAGEDARFLIMARDPRDVIASMVRVGERARKLDEAEGNLIPRDMNQLSKIYLDVYGPALSNKNPEYQRRVTVIRYEELVTRTDEVLDVLRQASGLKLEDFEASADWTRNDIDPEKLKASTEPWMSDLWGKGISSARIGTYREVLTPEEITLVEDLCAKPLGSFGYVN
jgi:hypothetical protein